MFAYFALGLGYLGLRHLVWPNLDDWRPRIEQALSDAAGRAVSVGRIQPGFEGLLPRLTIDGVTVPGDDGVPLLRAERVTAVLSFRALLSGEIGLSVLQVEAPRLTVERLDAQRLRVGGFEVRLDAPDDGRASRWLMSQRSVLIHDARVDWIDRETGRSQRVDGIDLSLGNVGRRHRGVLRVGAVPAMFAGLDAVYEFDRAPRSRHADWTRWRGEAFAAVESADTAGIAAATGRVLPLLAGRGDARVWVGFDGGRIDDAVVKLAATDLAARSDAGRVELADLALDARARRVDVGYDVRVLALEARDRGGFRLRAQGEQQVSLDPRGVPTGARVAFEGFDAGQALEAVRRLPLERAAAERLRPLRISGRVSALSGRWTSAARADFDAAVEFERLSLRYDRGRAVSDGPDAPVVKVPWFENLAGEAWFSPSEGALRVRGRDAVLGFPGLFEIAAIPMSSIEADARWTLDFDGAHYGIAMTVDRLEFANADARGAVRGTYRTGGRGPGLIDLTGSLERAQANRVARYLPLMIAPSVRDWVAHAIQDGYCDNVTMRLKGDLYDFPYRRKEDGEFVIDARWNDGTLAFAPGWPAIERFQGNLRFERAGMQVTMRSGRTYGVTLGSTQAHIRDFLDPLLVVEGGGEGPAQDMIRFVNSTPVATRIDDFTREARVDGTAALALKLELPLDHLDAYRVAGAVRFRGNTLELDRTIPTLSDVSGALEFSERGMALRDISATFLDGPLKVRGETPEPGRFVIVGEGTISADGMRAVVDNPLTRHLEGSARYRATIDVHRRASSLTIESDLQGLAAHLPAPFDKPAQRAWPLKVRTEAAAPADPAARAPRDRVQVTLDDRFRLLLERERAADSQKLLIRRAAFGIDAEPELPDRGLSVALRMPRIDLDHWGRLLGDGALRDAQGRAATEFAEGFSLMPNVVSLQADEIRVGGKDLHRVVVGATRAAGYWRANIHAREVDGYFSWRDAAPADRAGTLTARFTRLEIPKSRASEVESLLDTAPESLPALDVSAEEFVLGERRLGALSLKARNEGSAAAPVWRLEQLRLSHPSAVLDARGTWAPRRGQGARATELEFALNLADAGGLLAVYGLEQAMRGGAGRVDGQLTWAGSPLSIDYPSLDGALRLKIGKGQFLKTEPGIAKLIGVLNLQSLPRRLALDFRDVFAEGFAFDEVAGSVQVDDGIARTDDLTMRGVQAQVQIRGQADLARETQKVDVQVRPELNAGLASLAYGAMVNPAIGLGSFLAQLALSGPIRQLFSYEYEVVGSWADPQVTEKRRPQLPAPQPLP
ncbi:MAG TPA: YhdP family protein [Quisquiliibacterium sp.]|nr:YhdP family protein [Quisquiliibacterium sp.]